MNKDKTNGQKDTGKVVAITDTAMAAAKVKLQDSSKDSERSEGKSAAGSSGLGSLGMLGDYSSSEDSDE